MTDNIDFLGSEAEPGTEVVTPGSTSTPASHDTNVKAHDPAPKGAGDCPTRGALHRRADRSLRVGGQDGWASPPRRVPQQPLPPRPHLPPATEQPPADPVASDLKEIKSQLSTLADQLSGVQGKVEGMPKSGPLPDLKNIQSKMDELTKSVTVLLPLRSKVDETAKSVSALLPLTSKVNSLETRVGSFDAALKGLKERVSRLGTEYQSPTATATNPAAVLESPKPTTLAGAPALAAGIALFKEGRYQDAGEVFKKLESTSPNDARVSYYRAFIRGLTTNDWQGETLELAAKGASAEKAGMTKPADVDSAFADLPANLKDWLSFFRRQAR